MPEEPKVTSLDRLDLANTLTWSFDLVSRHLWHPSLTDILHPFAAHVSSIQDTNVIPWTTLVGLAAAADATR